MSTTFYVFDRSENDNNVYIVEDTDVDKAINFLVSKGILGNLGTMNVNKDSVQEKRDKVSLPKLYFSTPFYDAIRRNRENSIASSNQWYSYKTKPIKYTWAMNIGTLLNYYQAKSNNNDTEFSLVIYYKDNSVKNVTIAPEKDKTITNNVTEDSAHNNDTGDNSDNGDSAISADNGNNDDSDLLDETVMSNLNRNEVENHINKLKKYRDKIDKTINDLEYLVETDDFFQKLHETNNDKKVSVFPINKLFHKE